MASGIYIKAASGVKSAYQALAAQRELAGVKSLNGSKDKARQTAEDFEAVYLNSMFNQMFTSMEGDGPFGGGKSLGVWRSFLTDQYSRSFAKKGGIGIASEVYRSLLAQQEARTDAVRATTETRP